MYQRFQELLEQSGKTVYQVAKETGINESVFAMWKKRNGGISLHTAKKIADCLNVSLDELVSRTEKEGT